MAYVVLTQAQRIANADMIQRRLNAEVQRAGAALTPPVVPPTFGGIAGVIASPTAFVVIDNGDDDTMAGPKTVVVGWRDPADPPRELWVLHLWGPSARLLPLGLFVCDGIIASLSAQWAAKWALGDANGPLQYGRQFANIVHATVTDGIARQNIQICRDAIAAVMP